MLRALFCSEHMDIEFQMLTMISSRKSIDRSSMGIEVQLLRLFSWICSLFVSISLTSSIGSAHTGCIIVQKYPYWMPLSGFRRYADVVKQVFAEVRLNPYKRSRSMIVRHVFLKI